MSNDKVRAAAQELVRLYEVGGDDHGPRHNLAITAAVNALAEVEPKVEPKVGLVAWRYLNGAGHWTYSDWPRNDYFEPLYAHPPAAKVEPVAVPREPTQAMIDAAYKWEPGQSYPQRHIWRAMHDAYTKENAK